MIKIHNSRTADAYSAPECILLPMCAENVLCASTWDESLGDPSWDNNGEDLD